VKFSILKDCGVERQKAHRETEATCQTDEDCPQSHSEAEALVVPLTPGGHHNITLNRPKRSNFGVPPTRYDYEDMVSYV